MVGGRGKAGMPVKIQTDLQGQSVILNGVVKDVSYKDSKNVSILHVQAVNPSPMMKNRILSYVYGIFKD
ncbi:hypothetical protein [Salinispira pacifica]|uniref:hypothetical protein n=1 Tax=Salinispira pacifica TaxID=1307761 RepID=UPI000412131C|nr:hypothetical protein [Salinispira pacifica]